MLSMFVKWVALSLDSNKDLPALNHEENSILKIYFQSLMLILQLNNLLAIFSLATREIIRMISLCLCESCDGRRLGLLVL